MIPHNNRLIRKVELKENASSGININELNITDDFEISIDIPANSSNTNFTLYFNNIKENYGYVRNFANGNSTSGEISANGDCSVSNNSIFLTMRSNAHTCYDFNVHLSNSVKVTWQGGSMSDSQEICQIRICL